MNVKRFNRLIEVMKQVRDNKLALDLDNTDWITPYQQTEGETLCSCIFGWAMLDPELRADGLTALVYPAPSVKPRLLQPNEQLETLLYQHWHVIPSFDGKSDFDALDAFFELDAGHSVRIASSDTYQKEYWIDVTADMVIARLKATLTKVTAA